MMQRFEVHRVDSPQEYYAQGAANPPDEVQFEGVMFTDGTVTIRWRIEFWSTPLWTSRTGLERIHGHPEYVTRWHWPDGEPAVMGQCVITRSLAGQ